MPKDISSSSSLSQLNRKHQDSCGLLKDGDQVAIIIVTRNSAEVIIECIRSILRTTAISSYKIIIVDNDSMDDTLTRVTEEFSKLDNFHIIRLDHNVGYGKALNIGAHAADASLLLFLNPDVLFENDVVSIIKEYFQNRPDTAVAGPTILNKNGLAVASTWRRFPSPENLLLEYTFFASLMKRLGIKSVSLYNDAPLKCECKDVKCVSGACLAIRKEDFLAIGGFDTKIFLYSEELDLCKRLIEKTRKRVIYIKKARVIHLGGTSSNKLLKSQVARIALSSMFYYLAKHYSKKKTFAFFRILKLVSCLYLPWLKIIAKILHLPDELQSRLVEYKAITALTIKDINNLIS